MNACTCTHERLYFIHACIHAYRYDWRNVLKREVVQWGEPLTEWDAALKPLTASDRAQVPPYTCVRMYVMYGWMCGWMYVCVQAPHGQ